MPLSCARSLIRTKLKERRKALKQGSEGAPDAWLDVRPFATQTLDGLAVGDEIIVLTWLHQAHREVPKVHRGQARGGTAREPLRPDPRIGPIRSAFIT